MKRLCIASMICLTATLSQAEFEPPQHLSLLELRAASNAPVYVDYVAGFPASVTADVATSGPDSVTQALGFLQAYDDLYLQNHPDVELVHVRTEGHVADGQTVIFSQRFRGLPVYEAEITVHLAGDAAGGPPRVLHTAGMLLVPARTNTLPAFEIDPDLVPAITREAAEDAARAAVGNPAAEILGQTTLMVFAPSIFLQPPDPVLAYRVTVADQIPVQILVGANDGTELFQQPLLADSSGLSAFDLDLEDANGGTIGDTNCFNPTTMDDYIGNASGLDTSYHGDPDAVQAWFAARATYRYFHDNHGQHSYDDDDGELEVYVHAGISSGNASAGAWCGIQFGEGAPSYDVMGHEYMHMVIDETSDLNLWGQPGALNESISDIMGQAVDPWDWLIGEDRVGGFPALRNLAIPPAGTCLGNPCPDKMSQYVFTTADRGGVHTNANIINKAFYLMAVGGTHNGRPVAPMGEWLMRQLAWRVFRHLPSNASFNTARNAAVSWANYFFGRNEMSFQNVCTVRNAFAAVEIGWPDQNCDGVPEQPGDFDGDLIFDDGDNSGTNGDNLCPDGVTSNCDDNCLSTPNPSQADLDGNGVGDACDPDLDGDGIPNASDDCPTIPYMGDLPGDIDGDGTPNCADPDDDNDGILDDGDSSGTIGDGPCASLQTVNCDDNCKVDPNPTQFDGNANGWGDACDPDQDGDGIYVELDNCTFVYNPNQENADGDWYGDACDLCPNDVDLIYAYTLGVPEQNIDPKPYQPDSDFDGVPDLCDDFPFGSFALATNGDSYARETALKPDGSTDNFQITGPAGAGIIGRLYFDACDNGSPHGPAPEERIEIELTGMSESISGWVEDETGMIRGRIKPSALSPTSRGVRFRPRCDETYRIVLRAEPDFDGDESFSVRAALAVTGEGNQWTNNPPIFPDEPDELPDEDGDGLIDSIDLCPSNSDPTNADTDTDGIGDVCDTCPQRFNPDQGPVEFPTVLAVNGDDFGWSPPDDFVYVKGDLSDVSGLGIYTSGTGSGGVLSTAADSPSTYYLLRFDDCGTWGSTVRDGALP